MLSSSSFENKTRTAIVNTGAKQTLRSIEVSVRAHRMFVPYSGLVTSRSIMVEILLIITETWGFEWHDRSYAKSRCFISYVESGVITPEQNILCLFTIGVVQRALQGNEAVRAYCKLFPRSERRMRRTGFTRESLQKHSDSTLAVRKAFEKVSKLLLTARNAQIFWQSSTLQKLIHPRTKQEQQRTNCPQPFRDMRL